MTTTPTLDQLKRALAISEQIAALEAELKAIFGGSTSTKAATATKAAPTTGDGRKGKRSAATIAKMKASQQARWAKVKGKKVPAKAKTEAPAKAKAEAPATTKRKPMSPATKAKMAAAMKKRWALAKAGKAPAPTASKKK